VACFVEILTEHDLCVFARGQADADTHERVLAGLRDDPRVGEVLQRLQYESESQGRDAAE
jgi:hypothetical protein